MLVKEQDKAMIAPKPRSFAGLMELYEVNYIQLRLLLGNLQALPECQLLKAGQHIPVLLQKKEQTKHTTTFLLTYYFSEQDMRPDLLIRIYHDSQQVEVINHRCRLTGNWLKKLEVDFDTGLLCRWKVNRFLYKWIQHLKYYSYEFEK